MPVNSKPGRAMSLGKALMRWPSGDVSSTAATLAPALRYWLATRYSNGPLPMNTTRWPMETAWAFKAICAPPRL
ncbi:hypothetical protein D3C78_1718230 [compost metagenome]